MRGLRHWQALIVNVAGSSVGNLLPGGGAAGLAATYTICRSWGFSRRDISTSAIVTGVWNVLARIALPVLAILGLLAGRDQDVPNALEDAAVAGAVSGSVILAVFVSILASERAAVAIGQGIDKVIGRLWKRRSMSVRSLVVDLRARINDVVRTGWLSMTLGLVGFFGVYYLLFLLCAHTTGVDLPYGQLFAAYAIGRLLTAVGVTPGGLGVTEAATTVALVGWGAEPAEAAAAVVLFSVFTHFMEIPLGALGWAAWSMSPKKAPVEDDAASERTTDDGVNRLSEDKRRTGACRLPRRMQRKRRARESAKAQALLDDFVRDGPRAGLATTELTARPWKGAGRYRDRAAGLVPADRPARSGSTPTARYHSLLVPPRPLARFRGVDARRRATPRCRWVRARATASRSRSSSC